MVRKVKAIIERSSDGSYSVYMDADDMDYQVTGTGAVAEEAVNVFMGGYEDTRKLYAEEEKRFEEVDFEFVYDMASFRLINTLPIHT